MESLMEILEEFEDEYQPLDALEEALVRQMAAAEWQLRRGDKLETRHAFYKALYELEQSRRN